MWLTSVSCALTLCKADELLQYGRRSVWKSSSFFPNVYMSVCICNSRKSSDVLSLIVSVSLFVCVSVCVCLCVYISVYVCTEWNKDALISGTWPLTLAVTSLSVKSMFTSEISLLFCLFVCLPVSVFISQCVCVWRLIDWRPRTRPRASSIGQGWAGDNVDWADEITEGLHDTERWSTLATRHGKSLFICWVVVSFVC